MNAGLTFEQQSCLSCRKGEHGCDERQIFCQCQRHDHQTPGEHYREVVTAPIVLTEDDEEVIRKLLNDEFEQPSLFEEG